MYQHLSHKDRVAIAVLRAVGHSLEEIAGVDAPLAGYDAGRPHDGHSFSK